ncbi:MAG: ROK family transcriptional regulator [Spirochaetales bacterium]|nr:ROK family transcriptional regulator [Spirochaetales bacterium]MBR4477103.1 ROK family transcriptional regulator [Spirochaetales bacterium]MBR6235093.1 ROK family transcriptional regulator [Spirochaetales bacterium]
MPVDNNLFQKNANTSLVARLIWQRKSISRAEIARELNLYRSTVTNITSYLISSGVVVEGKRLASTQQGGRKAVELSINPNFGCVIGFDVQPSHYRSVILSADGTELWRETGSFGVIPITEMIEKVIERALTAHRNIRIPVIAMSFAIPGIVDVASGRVLDSFPFGVRDLDIRALVNSRYPFPVCVENDANTAAWVDILKNGAWGNAISVVADFHEESRMNSDIIGIGAGIGLILAGKVYRGTHNAAGEFKSITWKDGLTNQSGLPVEVLNSTIDNRASLSDWIEDTFRSFIPIISVMDVEKLILHGRPFADRKWVIDTLNSRVPSFLGLLDQYRCQMVFDSQDECVSASGAAMMCLHNLFSVPLLEDAEKDDTFTWQKTIDFLQGQKQ